MFTTTKLSNNRVLVEGYDHRGTEGQTVLDGQEWAEIKAGMEHDSKHDEFDAKVREFFAPIHDAIDQLHEDHAVEVDPLEFIVIQEPVESVAGTDGIVIKLNKDSTILRLLEGDATGGRRLLWINEELELLPEPEAAESHSATITTPPTLSGMDQGNQPS